jgi:hypothetical protein
MKSGPIRETPLEQGERILGELMKMGFHNLANALDIQALAKALEVPKTHKVHPLAHLCITGQYDCHAGQVLANLENALRWCANDHTGKASKWAISHLNDAARDMDFERLASMLSEIRAFGNLWSVGFQVVPKGTGSGPTRDFDLNVGSIRMGVEVHCKQMNRQEAEQLAKSYSKGPGTYFVYPAGQPKPNESTAENVASKFAQIKPGAKQADQNITSVLWLDLQDEDWWVLDISTALPVVISNGLFYSGGLWHAIYGNKGIPIFDGHSPVRVLKTGVPQMAHPGLFEQSPGWAAVILSYPRGHILFENPKAKTPLVNEQRESILRLPGFDFQTSRLSWPPSSKGLNQRIKDDIRSLSALSKVARFHT